MGLPSDRWPMCLGFYLNGPGPFCMGILHSGRLPALFVFLFVVRTLILCFISVVLGGGPVLGRGSSLAVFHLSKLGLGMGCSGPCR